ncbi:MAG: hypothetical protein KatS3mg109_1627 [Pirellulaceae bacterium]|nr:MAG: hypothetical protein KatS3mg109_1627 [Pirellulaceae bacterium]
MPCPNHCGRPIGSPLHDGRRTASPRRAPARGGGVMGGTRYGLWGARHAVPRPLWATRRVAPTRWATHRVVPTRTGTRWWGDGWDTVRPVGGTAYRTPTIVGDPPGRPDAMGDAVQWAMRTGMPWCGDGWDTVRHGGVRYVGARHAVPQPFWATRRVAPTRWVTHRVVPTRTGTDVGARQDGHGMPCPDHCGRPVGSPLRWATRRDG